MNNYLDEVRKKIWEFSDEAGRTEFSRIITKRMSVYFPYDVVYFAFLKRPWALDVAKELDVDIEALTEVRISRMDVDISIAETLADENASKLLKEIKTAKSEDTAGLFAKYSEYGLFHSDKNSRKEKNELSGIVDENTLKQAYYNEHSIKPESSFGNYPSDKFAVRFYGNPKVAEAFEIHLSGKDTRDSIFPEVVTVPDSNESVRFAFLAGLGNGTYRDDIRAPYIK